MSNSSSTAELKAEIAKPKILFEMIIDAENDMLRHPGQSFDNAWVKQWNMRSARKMGTIPSKVKDPEFVIAGEITKERILNAIKAMQEEDLKNEEAKTKSDEGTFAEWVDIGAIQQQEMEGADAEWVDIKLGADEA